VAEKNSRQVLRTNAKGEQCTEYNAGISSLRIGSSVT